MPVVLSNCAFIIKINSHKMSRKPDFVKLGHKYIYDDTCS